MKLAVVPMGKPRMTQRDRWKRRPVVERYHVFCDELRLIFNGAGATMPPDPVMEFYIPMPPSWSKKKRAEMAGQHHQAKPDIDNLIKSVLDALLEDDSYIYKVTATKFWSEEGYINLL